MADNGMTLQEWAAGWPYAVRQHTHGARWTPDAVGHEDHYTQAFRLSDYLVSSVSGGSIWFIQRATPVEQEAT